LVVDNFFVVFTLLDLGRVENTRSVAVLNLLRGGGRGRRTGNGRNMSFIYCINSRSSDVVVLLLSHNRGSLGHRVLLLGVNFRRASV
jgi:hypothetical protein